MRNVARIMVLALGGSAVSALAAGCFDVDNSCFDNGVCPPDTGSSPNASGLDGSVPFDDANVIVVAPPPKAGVVDAHLSGPDAAEAGFDAPEPEPEAGLETAAPDGSVGASGPVVLSSVALSGMLLEDATAIYGTANGYATAIGLQDGSTLAKSAVQSGGLWALSTASVFAPAAAGNPLYSFDKASLSATSILDTGGFGTWLNAAVSSSSLWVWSAGQQSPVTSLNLYDLTGGSPQNSAITSAGCMALAGDGLGIVYAAAAYESSGTPGPCTFYAMSPAGSDIVTLASPSGANPTVLTLGQGSAYWFNSTDDKLYASDRAGNGFSVLVNAALPNAPVQLAVDASRLYWTDGTAHTVSAVPVGSVGAIPVTIASGQVGAAGIVVDTKAIYWATATALMKLAK